MAKEIDLSIIIVSFNTKTLTRECIESVAKYTKGITYEFIAVDNNSGDGSVEMLKGLAKKYPLKLIANKENTGFGSGNNGGLKIAGGRYMLLLNSDTLIEDNVLGEMVDYMDENPGTGIASCALKFENGTIQGTGGYFPTLGRVLAWMSFTDDLPLLYKLIKPFHPMHNLSPLGKNEKFFEKNREVDWLTGAFFMMRREVFEKVGYFDKDYFMYVEEVDYCFRTKKLGWEIRYLPKWGIIHYGGASSTSEFSIINEIKGIKTFYKKHYPAWQMPFLTLILKFGTFLRIAIFGLLKGFQTAKIYAKAFAAV